MQKYAQYAAAIAGALLVLAVVVWANTSAVTTSGAAVSSRSGAAISPHEIMRGSVNLPPQVVRDPF
jgi:hypothetical protein